MTQFNVHHAIAYKVPGNAAQEGFLTRDEAVEWVEKRTNEINSTLYTFMHQLPWELFCVVETDHTGQ